MRQHLLPFSSGKITTFFNTKTYFHNFFSKYFIFHYLIDFQYIKNQSHNITETNKSTFPPKPAILSTITIFLRIFFISSLSFPRPTSSFLRFRPRLFLLIPKWRQTSLICTVTSGDETRNLFFFTAIQFHLPDFGHDKQKSRTKSASYILIRCIFGIHFSPFSLWFPNHGISQIFPDASALLFRF